MAPAETLMNGHINVEKSGHPDAAPGNLEEDSKYAASCLVWKMEQCFAFQATLKLKIPETLAKATVEGKPGLSAEEILEGLPARSSPAGPETVLNLRRLLQPLVVDGIFARSVLEDSKVVYSLTDLSKWFVKGNESNLIGVTDVQRTRPVRAAYENLEQIILCDTKSPFDHANSMPMLEYGFKHPDWGTTASAAMSSLTSFETPTLIKTLESSGMLTGVKNLVDVGGGVGTFLAQIIARNPHIHGINFDLPHVVNAPTADAVEGVEHVGGSFTDSVPSGDAIILKLVIHNNGDEESIGILRKCYEALPQNGKVLIIEYVMPEIDNLIQNPSWKGRMVLGMDLSMLTLLRGARERTLEEYAALTSAAGFSRPSLISNPGCIDIVQVFKS